MTRPALQVSVIGENGEAIVQVFAPPVSSLPGYAVLTVRDPATERLAEVRLNKQQAEAVAHALDQVREREDFE
jgi:hypothetical protein